MFIIFNTSFIYLNWFYLDYKLGSVYILHDTQMNHTPIGIYHPIIDISHTHNYHSFCGIIGWNIRIISREVRDWPSYWIATVQISLSS